MDIEDIKELIELIKNSTVEEFEMEKEGTRVRIRQSTNSTIQTVAAPAGTAQESIQTGIDLEITAETKAEEDLHIFKAPIVGTYYITPKPDAEPFINIGDRVTKTTVLCIIEAMKIFNQIECDVNGEIVDILVENGQPVEFGEPLFKIRLS